MLSQNAIFRLFRSASAGGADSGVIGVNGSVNSSSARAILHELDAKNRTILDFGAGDGKFLICAAVAGANHTIGIEFGENIGPKLLFDAVVHSILRRYSLRPSVQWIGMNIDQVRKIHILSKLSQS
jgi:predicted RNA methylase